MSEMVERINYFVSGLQQQFKIVGTVIQSFLFTFKQIYQGFQEELNDLQMLVMYQAG